MFTVVELAIHCGPIAGGYGCDMGEFPTPPAEFAIIFYAFAVAGLAVAAYTVISGRLLVRPGRLKQIWSQTAIRLLGLSLAIQSLVAVLLGSDLVVLSHRTVTSPEWLSVAPFPAILASLGLDWWAYHIDRRRTPPSVAA
jgi:hypothetical protein